MRKPRQNILLLSSLADLMLYRAFRLPSAQSACLVWPLAAIFWCLVCTLLQRRGIPADQNKIYPWLLAGYILISCIQMYCLLQEIWQNPLGQWILPVVLLLFAALLPGGNPASISLSAQILWGGAGLAILIFLFSAAPNMHLHSLATANGQLLRQNALMALGGLCLPVPEYVLLTDPALEMPPHEKITFPAIFCALQSGLCLAAELTFGQKTINLSLYGYEMAKIGTLFSLQRLETLQVIFWLCLLLWRLRFLLILLEKRMNSRINPVQIAILSAIGYFALLYLAGNIAMLFYAFDFLAAAAVFYALVGGLLPWKAKSKNA